MNNYAIEVSYPRDGVKYYYTMRGDCETQAVKYLGRYIDYYRAQIRVLDEEEAKKHRLIKIVEVNRKEDDNES